MCLWVRAHGRFCDLLPASSIRVSTPTPRPPCSARGRWFAPGVSPSRYALATWARAGWRPMEPSAVHPIPTNSTEGLRCRKGSFASIRRSSKGSSSALQAYQVDLRTEYPQAPLFLRLLARTHPSATMLRLLVESVPLRPAPRTTIAVRDATHATDNLEGVGPQPAGCGAGVLGLFHGRYS